MAVYKHISTSSRHPFIRNYAWLFDSHLTFLYLNTLGVSYKLHRKPYLHRYCVRDFANNKRTYYRYEEVTYEEQINESYEKAIYRYAHASNRLKHEGIRPVFATIPPSCLEKWNDYRLYFGNTDFLLHHTQYDNMQQGLMEAIIKINGFICKLNALHHVYTPYLAGTVVKTHSADGRNPILQRHKLFDGVHADDLLIEEWAGKIKKSINKNRLTPTSNLPSLQYHSSEHLAYILEGITL